METKQLTKLQQEIRTKLILYTIATYKDDYHLSDEDIGDIFGITKQAIRQIRVKNA